MSLDPAAPFDGTTIPPNQRTGWSSDGAPGNGTLREFAIGAVIQHFTKTLNRKRGKDFVLPTSAQLDQLEAFQLALGPQEEPMLPTLHLRSPFARQGQQAFMATEGINGGKCVLCHFNAGANVGPFEPFGSESAGLNRNFDTGVENFPNPADKATDEPLPADGGFGTSPGSLPIGFGNGTFNTPTVVPSADTSPFFHNNAVNTTIEDAVNFYNSAAFNNSPAGVAIGGIALGEFQAVGAFLRVINALENIRSSIDLETRALDLSNHERARRLLKISIAELEDAVEVLQGAQLHLTAVNHLKNAIARDKEAIDASTQSARNALINQALVSKNAARADIVE